MSEENEKKNLEKNKGFKRFSAFQIHQNKEMQKIKLIRKKTEPLFQIEKLKKILLKGIKVKDETTLKELYEQKDPHIEKFSILQNKNFLEHAIKYYIQKQNLHPIFPFNNKNYNDNLEKLKNKAIEYIKSSKINIEESEYIFQLLNYLNPFYETLKKSNENSYKKIITKLIFLLKHESFNENNIIFRFNDISEKYYIIINGEVDFLVPNEEYAELTLEEYFDYLMKLRNNNEDFLLEQTIERNKDKYYFKEKNFDIWIKRAYSTICDSKIRNKVMEKKKEEEKERKIIVNNRNLFKKDKDEEKKKEMDKITEKKIFIRKNFIVNIPPFETEEEIELSIKLEKEIKETFLHIQMMSGLFKKAFILEKNNLNINSKKYIERLLPKKRDYGNRIIRRYNFLIFKYYISQKCSQGNFFGEMYADSSYNNDNNRRIETAITNEKCDFGVLNKISFNELLLDTYEKGRKDLLEYLLNINVFKNFNLSQFMRNFTKIFEYQKIEYKECLYNQNDIISNEDHYIYFIVDGFFDSYSNLSISDMDNILIKTNLKNKIDENEIEQIKNFPDYYIKREIKFESFGKGDIIGLNDCNLYGKYLYNIVCSTQNAFVFRVHISYIKLIISLDNAIKENINKFQNIKTDIVYNMLLKQRECKVNFFKEKYHDHVLLNSNKIEEKKIKIKISKRLNSCSIINNNLSKIIQNKSKVLKPISLKIINDRNNIDNENKLSFILKDNYKSRGHKKFLSYEPSNKQTINSTYTNNNNLTSTLNNTPLISSRRNDSLMYETSNSYRKDLYIKKIKNKLINQGRKMINGNELSIDKENNINYFLNDYMNYQIKQKQKLKFINPLIYDNFNKKFNTLDYYKPKNYKNNQKCLKYQLLIANKEIQITKHAKTNKTTKTRNFIKKHEITC